MLPFDDKNPFVPVLGTDKIKILITPPDIKKCSSENLNFIYDETTMFSNLKIPENLTGTVAH